MRQPDPERAAAAGLGTDGGAKTNGREGQAEAYRHDPTRCVTCSGAQHRDVVADLWWNWGANYRQEVAA